MCVAADADSQPLSVPICRARTTCCRFGVFFFRVQVAVLPPSMLSPERRKSGSRRPLGDPAPFILEERRRLSTPGLRASIAGGKQDPWAAGRGTSGTGAAVIPAALREDEPKGENAPHLGLKLLPGAGAGEPSLRTPPAPHSQTCRAEGGDSKNKYRISPKKAPPPPLLLHINLVHFRKTRGKGSGLRIAIFRRNAGKAAPSYR